MTTFVDVSCQHCGRRFGWQVIEGKPEPACPGCGKRASDAVQEAKSVMEKIGPQPATGVGFFKTRRASGLTFSQAAVQLGISKTILEDIEEGREVPTGSLLDRMQRLYDMEFVQQETVS